MNEARTAELTLLATVHAVRRTPGAQHFIAQDFYAQKGFEHELTWCSGCRQARKQIRNGGSYDRDSYGGSYGGYGIRSGLGCSAGRGHARSIMGTFKAWRGGDTRQVAATGRHPQPAAHRDKCTTD